MWNPVTYRKPTDEKVARFDELQERQTPAAKSCKCVTPKPQSVDSKSNAKDSAGKRKGTPQDDVRNNAQTTASGAPTGAALKAGDKCEVLYEGQWDLATLTDTGKTQWKVICDYDSVVRHAC